MRFERRLLGWGAFFIILGAIPLAIRLGYLDPALVTRWWSLWPLLLIGWGLGLVLRETPVDWLGGVVTTVTFGIMGGSLIATGFTGVPFGVACGSGEGQPFAEQHGALASPASVSIDMPCGELTIEPVDGNEWSLAGSSGPNRTPVVKTDSGGLQISGREDIDFGGSGRPVWNVGLPRGPEGIQLDLTLNAGKGRATLAGLHLNGVQVTLNAGDLAVAIAEAASFASVSGTVNAGSLGISIPASGTAEFTVNAGSLSICLPEGAAVRVESTSTLGSNNLDDLGLESTGENTWQTAGYASAAEKVELSVQTNAGSFELAIGASCGA